MLSQIPQPGAGLPGLSASKLVKTLTKEPKTMLPNNELLFGKTFSDHMLTVEWDNKNGEHSPLGDKSPRPL